MFFESKEPTPIEEDLHGIIKAGRMELNIVLPDDFNHYACPITKLMLFDPVTNRCGHHYESKQIEAWLREEKKEICPCCSEPITDLEPNMVLKAQIQTCLMTIRNQLEQDIQAQPGNKFNRDRQKIIRLCNHFVRYGNHEATLKGKFDEFCEHITQGNVKSAAEASRESSVIASRTCVLL